MMGSSTVLIISINSTLLLNFCHNFHITAQSNFGDLDAAWNLPQELTTKEKYEQWRTKKPMQSYLTRNHTVTPLWFCKIFGGIYNFTIRAGHQIEIVTSKILIDINWLIMPFMTWTKKKNDDWNGITFVTRYRWRQRKLLTCDPLRHSSNWLACVYFQSSFYRAKMTSKALAHTKVAIGFKEVRC